MQANKYRILKNSAIVFIIKSVVNFSIFSGIFSSSSNYNYILIFNKVITAICYYFMAHIVFYIYRSKAPERKEFDFEQ